MPPLREATSLTELWPWLALAGLGMFHGVNPAMGWLFAVALGLHRHSRQVVVLSLVPIALGHALSITVVLATVMLLGVVVDHRMVHMAAGVLLIAWALYHWLFGHRHRVRVGMRTGYAGLTLWSFVMATGHGAGLMLVPALMPLHTLHTQGQAGHGHPIVGAGSLWLALAAVGVHTMAMLLVTGMIAIMTYEWLGVGVLRRGWINFDVLWTIVLLAAGALLLLVH
jgi:hypothetical protein